MTFHYSTLSIEREVPLAPERVWAISPKAALIVGVSDGYQFEFHHMDGRINRVIREMPSVAVRDIEAEWHRQYVRAVYGWNERGDRVDVDWDEKVPSTKPAFRRFIPAASGEVWVVREGPAQIIPDCELIPIKRSGRERAPPRCHESATIVDAFEAAGRYLGEVTIPEGMSLVSPFPHIRYDTVVGLVQDEDGVSRVKRYRLVLPREE